MKALFENIIKATPSNTRNYIISQLQQLSNKFTSLESSNNNYKARITGVKVDKQRQVLERCLDLLKLHGYTLPTLTSFNESFIDFMLNNTLRLEKYKAKQINFEILNDLQQAYFIYKLEKEKEPNDYYELRSFLLKIAETKN